MTTPAALSFDAKPVRLRDYLPTIPDTHSICVFVGAMAHGCVCLARLSPPAALVAAWVLIELLDYCTVPTTLPTTSSTRRLPSRSTRSVRVSPAAR